MNQPPAPQQIAAATDTFTLLFPGDQIVMLEVHGAANPEAARAVALQAVRHCQRINLSGDQIEIPINCTVIDGNVNRGCAAYVCSWTCAAQECQPHYRPEPKRNSHLSHLGCARDFCKGDVQSNEEVVR